MTSRPTRKRLWGKRLTRAILCLLLGAVTTVGVAWGCVLLPNQGALSPAPFFGPGHRTLTTEGPGTTVEESSRMSFESMVHHFERALSTGWPLRALRLERDDDFSLRSGTRLVCSNEWRGARGGWYITAGPLTAQGLQTQRFLPLLPIWPGFLFDTLFYAAPWWLILVTPGALRRFRRRRRGRCIHCGYDQAGLPRDDNTTPTCPECGA